jgi:hypothetical protein
MPKALLSSSSSSPSTFLLTTPESAMVYFFALVSLRLARARVGLKAVENLHCSVVYSDSTGIFSGILFRNFVLLLHHVSRAFYLFGVVRRSAPAALLRKVLCSLTTAAIQRNPLHTTMADPGVTSPSKRKRTKQTTLFQFVNTRPRPNTDGDAMSSSSSSPARSSPVKSLAHLPPISSEYCEGIVLVLRLTYMCLSPSPPTHIHSLSLSLALLSPASLILHIELLLRESCFVPPLCLPVYLSVSLLLSLGRSPSREFSACGVRWMTLSG